MSSVNLHAVVTGSLVILRRPAEPIHDHPHLRDGHLVGYIHVSRRGDGGRRQRKVVRQPTRLLATKMEDLAEDARVVTLDGLHALAKRFDALLIPCLGQDPLGKPRGFVHDGGPGDDESHTPAGSLLLKPDVALRHSTHFDQARAHRQLNHPVADRYGSDRAGREEMGIVRGSGVLGILWQHRGPLRRAKLNSSLSSSTSNNHLVGPVVSVYDRLMHEWLLDARADS